MESHRLVKAQATMVAMTPLNVASVCMWADRNSPITKKIVKLDKYSENQQPK